MKKRNIPGHTLTICIISMDTGYGLYALKTMVRLSAGQVSATEKLMEKIS